MKRPRTEPTRNANRQPMSGSNRSGFRTAIDATAPSAPPIQNEPLMARSVHPRYRAGIISWIVEFTALFSPPIPAPVKNRNRQKLARFQLSAVLHPTLAVLRSPVRAVSSQAVAGAPCWPCHFRELPARALLGWSVRPQEALCHQFRRANSWASTGRLGTVRYRANAKECSPRGARTRLDRYTAR
jgi:hypothetical protein